MALGSSPGALGKWREEGVALCPSSPVSLSSEGKWREVGVVDGLILESLRCTLNLWV